MRKQWTWAMAVLMTMSLIGLTPATFAKGSDTRIALTGSAAYPAAKGKAKYRDRGGEREFQVEVENIRSLAGTTLTVLVDGKLAGTARVTALGAAELNRNTDRRQAVPAIRSGSTVVVKSSANAVVATGRFP